MTTIATIVATVAGLSIIARNVTETIKVIRELRKREE